MTASRISRAGSFLVIEIWAGGDNRALNPKGRVIPLIPSFPMAGRVRVRFGAAQVIAQSSRHGFTSQISADFP